MHATFTFLSDEPFIPRHPGGTVESSTIHNLSLGVVDVSVKFVT